MDRTLQVHVDRSTWPTPPDLPATREMAKQMHEFSGPASSPRVRRNNSRQSIREGRAFARPVQTSPAAHPKLHGHDSALHG